MAQFLKICDYFEITPLQFFDAEAVNPQLIRKAMDGMRKLKDEDLIMLIGFINRLQSKDWRRGFRPLAVYFCNFWINYYFFLHP